MTIFTLHSTALADYADFVRAFHTIADGRIREYVDRTLSEEAALWPDFLLQLSPSYKRGPTVEDLARRGLLHREAARAFCTPQGEPYRLYQHQAQSLEKALRGKSYVVTSGTGSGKSLCYFLPIVEYILRQGLAAGQTVALIVYPMNALVNSQLQALEMLKRGYQERTGREFPVTFARYTGETSEEERHAMRAQPPHILLTNYMMAELILVRPEDRQFLDKEKGGLHFLVFDELHTYRGRQGADVAMLIRRLKECAAAPDVVHVGTSATMIASRQASPAERRQAVADFAARLFGHPFGEEDIIEETLEPFTEGGEPAAEELRQALEDPPPASLEAYRRHPLSRWIEHTFGLEPDGEGGYRRRIPQTLAEAAGQLAEWTGAPQEQCVERLREWLSVGGRLMREDGTRAFAFKLHQFIAQGRTVSATLEPADRRALTLGGEVQTGEDKIFFPLRFCRQCGQEYYHVLQVEDRFLPQGVGVEGSAAAGYVMLAPEENDWSQDLLPEEWRDGKGRLKPDYRERIPKAYWARPDGRFFAGEVAGAVKVWYQPEPFALCLNCGEFYTRREEEFRKLASLSSEARTSATTMLSTSLLRHAARLRAAQDKLLTFTDNRQDAALQAGHFNDFIHLAAVRTSLVAALKKEKAGLTADRIAQAVVEEMRKGFTLRDIAQNPDLNPETEAAREVWKTFTSLTEYRLYEDLRRGWRVTQPNLEELGLLHIAYRGLEELGRDEHAWAGHPMAQRHPEDRQRLLRVILDHFRRKLAIHTRVLTEEEQDRLRRLCDQHLNDFWGLDPDTQELRPANYFQWGQSAKPTEGFSLSERSALGRFLMRELGIGSADYRGVMEHILQRLVEHGLLVRANASGEAIRYQLDASCLVWRYGEGQAPPMDPLYTRRVKHEAYAGTQRPVNAFLQQFYQGSVEELAKLEAREHTAQVVAPGERERRERRFRWEKSDMTKESELGRRLPYLVCSPTMELGIDIADLDIVHMRNVPPTPANYAQRSGRAGRQGQAGLIFTYCGAFSPHDQYFFRNRHEMVAGSVHPPKLDLANETLLRAHLHAMWLGEIRLSLGRSIENVLDTTQNDLPLREEVADAIRLRPWVQERLAERMRQVLQADMAILHATPWFTEDWIGRVLQEAPREFDRAFDRWRELYRAAMGQLQEAQQAVCTARKKDDQAEALRRQQEALRQRNLLLQIDVQREEGDFYPYRYLASEGFLPGYNFPALPVRAWVPRGKEGEFIARPRFLALREFAPGNILYHEGAKWEVIAFQAPPGGLEDRLTRRRLCNTCGTFCDPSFDRCPACNALFDASNSVLALLLDMPNVKTRRRERITSDEEERRRHGYDLQTYYQFAPEGEGMRRQEADVVIDGQAVWRLIYGPAATILRINRGWRAARTSGFKVDFESGQIALSDALQPPFLQGQKHLQTVNLAVQITQNLLLIRPVVPDLFADRTIEATLQYALQRGLEEVYQLEEDELATECLGEGENRAILLYETSEGGSGVLRRLVEEANALAQVAQAALRRIHYDEQGSDQKPDCYAACYECLLSFSNQADALSLNRHRIRDILLGIAHSRTLPRVGGRSWEEQWAWLRALTDARSDLERRFLDVLAQGRFRLPDDAQRQLVDPHCRPDFFYEPDICVFCDGAVHDEPAQRAQDESLRDALRRRGYQVIVIRYDQDLREQIRRYPQVFGRE